MLDLDFKGKGLVQIIFRWGTGILLVEGNGNYYKV